MSLESKVVVNTHYTRSVNLERDADSIDVINAYIPTSRALRTFTRVANAMHSGQAPRAWSWIGPYGSGKSSASVFLGQLLADPESKTAQAALNILNKSDPETAEQFRQVGLGKKGTMNVFLTGAPEPMSTRLVKSLISATQAYWKNIGAKEPELIKNLEKLAVQKKVKVSEFISAINQVQLALEKTNCTGLVLIVDEFGKFLEYEARHYDANDIYLLQALAEHACSGSKVNLMLFVLLHQSFEQYAKGLGESLKQEWSKVQGRFEEVPFIESTEQVLRVVGAAFEHNFKKAEQAALTSRIKKIISILDKQAALPGVMTKSELSSLFDSCYPLHPVSAVLLPALCQKIAQNERTLFSYLGSYEEFGLQDMLKRLVDINDFIKPHHIYDYFITNQSSAIGDYITHRRWAEVVTAVDRVDGENLEVINLLKTIGILNIVGSKGGFRASYAVLETCYSNKEELDSLLKVLSTASVITYRKFSGEYRVWQGSDFDLEDALQEELNNLGDFSLVKEINESKLMSPIVARRYTIKNGALRYFVPLFIDAISYKKEPKSSDEPRVLFYLARAQDDEKLFYSKVLSFYSELDIVVLCLSGTQLHEAVTETQALKRVAINNQELNIDPIAKREYDDRLIFSEQATERLIHALVELPQETAWYNAGKNLNVSNKRQLQEVFSSVLEDVYCKAPIIHNELINRDRPSSQAVSARNKLLYAMLSNEKQRDLGIEKFPPEKSIYRSVLYATGLHESLEIDGDFQFIKPDKSLHADASNISYVWSEIEYFLNSTESKDRSFVELSNKLMAAPYGVKAGILPILYIASYLAYKGEIAIYENRLYKPVFTQEMLERFVKRPDEFTVQRFKIDGMRSSIFEQYAAVIHKDNKKRTLLELATPLAKFMGGLPEYTQKTRRDLSDKAEKVRSAFNLAKSPEKLLFEELPVALGFEKVSNNVEKVEVEGFSVALTEALRELKYTYENLLKKQRELLAQAFNLDSKIELADLRKIITKNCDGLDNYTVDTQGLRAFIMRLIKKTGSDEEWFENILMFLSHKPSAKWLDSDRDEAEYRLTDLSKRVIDLEKIRIHQQADLSQPDGDAEVYLLRSVKKGGNICDEIVTINASSAKEISSTINAIKEQLSKLEDKELMLAALAETVDSFLNNYKD